MTMRSRSKQAGWRSRAASVAVGALLASLAITPAHADSVRERQWYLDAMHAEQMWKISTGKGITVAVIDTGVQADIPDLRGQVVAGKDFSKRAGDERTDYDGHGTTTAALIAGTGAKGATTGSYGLAPGAKIMPIRIPGFIERNRTDGNQDDFPTAAAKAIRFAADSDARIINISAGSTAQSRELTDAVAYALSKGKLIFAAAGNDGDTLNALQYPAATPGAVGVGAIDRNVTATKESEHGPQVDLVAPGEDIVSACLGGTELCNSHGTSDATALTSASAALIWSKHLNWTNNQVLRVMLNTASKPTSGKERTDSLGYGAVRPRIALTSPGVPGPADVYPLPDFKQAASKTPKGTATASTRDEGSSTASASKINGSALPWIFGGAGVVVLAGGVLIAAAFRKRRRAAAVAHAPVAMPPGPGQTTWYGDSNYRERS
ncbi:type VII secretion-associated serine protease mycosin [Streptomyces sp. Ag109_G2-15]|uniref:type VII secretion-associated serine protease mycosin n=1 Tax=Streptomyces sp. Ag109_G2-15 TaxID=1938850 RepID=UPI000BE2FDDD|nr:type VII secretion-associated serine protease mycosin [Streptomyces sp. Ag109_G2-15]